MLLNMPNFWFFKTVFCLLLLALVFGGFNNAHAQYTLPQQLPNVYQNYNTIQAQNKYLQEQKNKEPNQPSNEQSTAQPNPEAVVEPTPAQAQEQVVPAQIEQMTEQQTPTPKWPWVVGLVVVVLVLLVALRGIIASLVF
jgi:outer membrane biosynthesis protein TonB